MAFWRFYCVVMRSPDGPVRPTVFVILTILLSAPFWWLTRQGGHLFYMNALMWSPAAAAVLALKFTGGSLSDLGWRGSRWKWLLLAWLTVVGAMFLLSVTTTITGLTGFPNEDFVQEQTQKLHLPDGTSATLVVAWYALLALVVGGIGTGAAALGEELGWRGFLTVETQRRWGFTISSLVVGGLWGLWHFPLMWGNVPTWYLCGFMVGIVAYSFAYGWFRLVSGSVWPSVVLHAFHNALFGFYSRAFIFPPEGDAKEIWLGESGFVFGTIAVMLATLFWWKRSRAVQAFDGDERSHSTHA